MEFVPMLIDDLALEIFPYPIAIPPLAWAFDSAPMAMPIDDDIVSPLLESVSVSASDSDLLQSSPKQSNTLALWPIAIPCSVSTLDSPPMAIPPSAETSTSPPMAMPLSPEMLTFEPMPIASFAEIDAVSPIAMPPVDVT